MRRIINERSRNRKKSQNQVPKKTYNTIFLGGVEVEKKQSLRLESNDKLFSIIGQSLIRHMNNSNSNPSEIISESKIVTSNQSNNTNSRGLENKTSSSKENLNTNSSKDKMSLKRTGKNNFNDYNIKMSSDVSFIFNGKPVKKSEEELLLDDQYNTIDYFLKSLAEKNKIFKSMHESKEAYSSSNIGFLNTTKASTKSEEKNTKVTLQNLMESDIRHIRGEYPSIILNDKIDVEKADNKLEILMKVMEDYKDIIMEKIYCKNFQDRIMLSIFLCLSQLSFKLYESKENSKKLNNFRHYICGMTGNIKYNLTNNPNFTFTSINQKYIEIIDIKNQNINKNENHPKDNNNNNNEHANLSLHENSSFLSENSNMTSNDNNKYISYKYNYDDEEQDIINENFEDFNECNEIDKDYLYQNNNILYGMDNEKENKNINNNENHPILNKHTSNDEDNEILSKLSKNKFRRNATHKINFEKGTNKNNTNYTSNVAMTTNRKQKNYEFQIIDINDKNNLENKDNDIDDSIDSEEGIYEIHENHKYDIPKLLFYEDHINDKDKRKINKNNHVEIRADPEIIKDKKRLKELNDMGYNNIITIINKDPKLLPNHELNLTPFEINEFIKEREKKQIQQIILNNPKMKDKDGEKRHADNHHNNSFFSNISKSDSYINEEEFGKNKILNFADDEEEEENDEDEEDEEDDNNNK
jgi:hypothetical protein